jgi:hypothetical protein
VSPSRSPKRGEGQLADSNGDEVANPKGAGAVLRSVKPVRRW